MLVRAISGLVGVFEHAHAIVLKPDLVLVAICVQRVRGVCGQSEEQS